MAPSVSRGQFRLMSSVKGIVVGVVTMLLGGPATTLAAPVEPGTLVQRSYTNAAGTRTYYVFAPVGGAAQKPLMVWLHGCGGPLTMQAGCAG